MTFINDESLLYTYRSSLNWLSLLVLQWMNYGLLCISMIVGSISVELQPLIHDAELLPQPHEVLVQLDMLWERVAMDCNLTSDERDSLLFTCVQNVFHILQKSMLKENWSILSDANATKDQRFDALCKYEQLIHTEVFLPAWRSVKVSSTCQCDLITIHFIVERRLYSIWSPHCYPHEVRVSLFYALFYVFFSELRRNVPQLSITCNDPLIGFLHVILSSTNLHDKSCQLFTLYQFVLARPALNVGAIVLPKLVDLYCWIHNNLQYTVTVETAKSHSTQVVFHSLLDKLFPTDRAERMNQMEIIICK